MLHISNRRFNESALANQISVNVLSVLTTVAFHNALDAVLCFEISFMNVQKMSADTTTSTKGRLL